MAKNVSKSRHRHDNFIRYVLHREIFLTRSGYHAANLYDMCSLRGHKPILVDTPMRCRSVYLLRLNPDMRYIAAAHGDTSIGIYCASSGRMLATCLGHERSPWSLDFHPNKPNLLASGCLGGGLRLWDLTLLSDFPGIVHWEHAITIKSFATWVHQGPICSVAFHPLQPILVVTFTQEIVFFNWAAKSMISCWRFASNHTRARWVRFDHNGASLFTATSNPPAPLDVLQSFKKADREKRGLRGTGIVQCTLATSNNPRPFTTNVLRPSVVTRKELLNFLLEQSQSWFDALGVCYVCSIRLCQWAGTLGPTFPTPERNIDSGLSVAVEVAKAVAYTHRLLTIPISQRLRDILRLSSCDVIKEILGELRPSAVTVIEDVPVFDFLYLLGDYCSSSPDKPVVGNICCGRHATDLLSTRRHLLRHSLCRRCLTSFWRWAMRTVLWWDWHLDANATHCSSDLTVTFTGPLHGHLSESSDPSLTVSSSDGHQKVVGLCSDCTKAAHLQCADRLKPDSPISRPSSPQPNTLGQIGHPWRLLRSQLARVSPYAGTLPCEFQNLMLKGMLTEHFQSLFSGSLQPSVSEGSYPNTGETNSQPPSMHDSKVLNATNGPTQSAATSESRFPTESFLTLTAKATEGYNHLLPCGRCGRMVSSTNFIDPSSTVSDLICERLILPDEPYICADDLRLPLPQNLERLPVDRHGVITFPIGSERSINDAFNGSGGTDGSGSSLLMSHSLNESMSGLFVDFGDNGPANCLHDSTYRVCAWQLGLFSGTSSFVDGLKGSTTHYDTDKPSLLFIRPIPTNVTSTYDPRNVIASHVRLSNDASISVSSDGRMLAAFAEPNGANIDILGCTPSKPSTILSVFRIYPIRKRGQCLFSYRFDSISHVCLSFSPMNDFLVVGMSTTDVSTEPSTAPLFYSTQPGFAIDIGELHRSCNSWDQPCTQTVRECITFVARIFQLDEVLEEKEVNNEICLQTTRSLMEVGRVAHPAYLEPVSASLRYSEWNTFPFTRSSHIRGYENLNRWHRMLLSAPTAASVNSVIWHPRGGLIYGTDKGMIVLMETQPDPVSDVTSPNTNPTLPTGCPFANFRTEYA